MKKNTWVKRGLSLASYLFSLPVFASTYALPTPSQDLLGTVQYSSTTFNDNVVEVAKRYNLGVNQVANANPHIDPGRGFQEGKALKLPTSHILPPLPRQGIVI